MIRLVEYRSCYWKSIHPQVRLSATVGLDETWLIRLQVDEEVRGAGLGAEAVRAVVALRPGNPVYLYAQADHEANQRSLERFYRRMGFRKFGPVSTNLMRRLPCR